MFVSISFPPQSMLVSSANNVISDFCIWQIIDKSLEEEWSQAQSPVGHYFEYFLSQRFWTGRKLIVGGF